MSRIAQLHWVMVGLLIGTFWVCPAWGETAAKPLSPEEVPPAFAVQPGIENYGVVLLSAVSRKSHMAAGEFDIDLPVETYGDAGVEPRPGGPTQVVLTFSVPADGVDVQTSAGSVDAILVEGSQATVELSDVPNGICLVLGVLGVTGMESEAWVRIRVLAGDVNGEGVVSILDLVQIRHQLNQTVTAANFRADVNADGSINIFDLVQVRNRLNTMAVCPQVDMVPIPAGEFQMGDTFNEGHSRERPVHRVYVDAFYADRCEVTNQQYATALNWAWSQGNLITINSGVVYQQNSETSYPYFSTNSAPSESPHSGQYSQIAWNGSMFSVVAGRLRYPVVQVSWYGAAAYANWRSTMEGRTPSYDLSTWTCDFNASGYRLPTEAEWEKAARGGVSGQRFPWSSTDTIQHAQANYYSDPVYSYDTSPTRGYHPVFAAGGLTRTNPVDYFEPNGYGLYGMAGNAYEWCNDWCSSTYYASSPRVNPRGPATGGTRVLRGGSWNNYAYSMRCSHRHESASSARLCGIVGLRLVMPVGSDSQ